MGSPPISDNYAVPPTAWLFHPQLSSRPSAISTLIPERWLNPSGTAAPPIPKMYFFFGSGPHGYIGLE